MQSFFLGHGKNKNTKSHTQKNKSNKLCVFMPLVNGAILWNSSTIIYSHVNIGGEPRIKHYLFVSKFEFLNNIFLLRSFYYLINCLFAYFIVLINSSSEKGDNKRTLKPYGKSITILFFISIIIYLSFFIIFNYYDFISNFAFKLFNVIVLNTIVANALALTLFSIISAVAIYFVLLLLCNINKIKKIRKINNAINQLFNKNNKKNNLKNNAKENNFNININTINPTKLDIFNCQKKYLDDIYGINKNDLKIKNNFMQVLVFSFIIFSFMLSLVWRFVGAWYFLPTLFLFAIGAYAISYELAGKANANKIIGLLFLPTDKIIYAKAGKTEKLITDALVIESEYIMYESKKDNKEMGETLDKNNKEKTYPYSFVMADVLKKFSDLGIGTKTDAEWIIANVLNKNLVEAKLEREISIDKFHQIMEYASIRTQGKPVTKIFGWTEFYGKKFIVNDYVLSPRPETEILVEEVSKLINIKSSVLDLCTGSGCIAIMLKIITNAKIFASDISDEALVIAKENAKSLNAKVEFIKSDIFDGIKRAKFDVIVSNPPYIKSSDIDLLQEEVKNFDPILALDGGESGYYFYKTIIDEAPMHLNKNGYIAFEVGYMQASYVKKLLQKNFIDIRIVKDYNDIQRVVIAKLKE